MATETINYTITFLSDWHAGSGLGSGAEADAVVIKDKNNLPYLPGKTFKGLIKDVLLDIFDVQPDRVSKEKINDIFGYEVVEKGEVIQTIPGKLFFSNVTLPEEEALGITEEMKPFLYKNIASTKIDENGVAKASSLRTMEVCIPLTIEGSISGEISMDEKQILEMGFKMLRHLGSNRNRGLGRCSVQLKK